MFQKTLTGGRYNESSYPVQELRRKRGGGRIFEGGVLAGHYGTCTSGINNRESPIKSHKPLTRLWTLALFLQIAQTAFDAYSYCGSSSV